MSFPTIGHTHPSFFRNADVTARLDVRPWPIAWRWKCGTSTTGSWSGGAGQAQNLRRVARDLQNAACRSTIGLEGDVQILLAQRRL